MEGTRILFDTTYTTKDLHRKVMLLKEFFSNYFFKEHGEGSRKELFDTFLQDVPVPEKLKEQMRELSPDFFESFTSESFVGMLDGLEKQVSEGPVLKLYIPTILPPDEIQKLGLWVRENIRESMFLDLESDPRSVGGCRLVWNGVYHDYSFRYQFEKHKNEVKTLLRNFDNG